METSRVLSKFIWFPFCKPCQNGKTETDVPAPGTWKPRKAGGRTRSLLPTARDIVPICSKTGALRIPKATSALSIKHNHSVSCDWLSLVSFSTCEFVHCTTFSSGVSSHRIHDAMACLIIEKLRHDRFSDSVRKRWGNREDAAEGNQVQDFFLRALFTERWEVTMKAWLFRSYLYEGLLSPRRKCTPQLWQNARYERVKGQNDLCWLIGQRFRSDLLTLWWLGGRASECPNNLSKVLFPGT